MSYASILVHVTPDQGCDHLIAAAQSVAVVFGASLIGVGAETCIPQTVESAVGSVGIVDVGLFEAERDLMDEDLAAAQARFRALTMGAPVGIVWRSYQSFPTAAVAWQACAADLLVVGRWRREGGDVVRQVDPGDVIMQAGRPVLLVPDGVAAIRPQSVVVAWKNTREARRAVSDALPFLRKAAAVTLACVREKNVDSDDSADDVIAYLGRHGVKAEVERLTATRGEVETQFMMAAEQRACDLIVAGAYGHARLREWAFGGMTEVLMTQATVPVLFSR